MNRFLIWLSLWAAAAMLAASAGAQEIEVTSYNGPLKSFCSGLAERHIECDQESLIRAVKNDDPLIRTLAVFALAERRNPDADKVIAEAFAREQNQHEKLEMSKAVLSRKDETPIAYLASTCTQPDTPLDVRLQATDDLNMFGRAAPCMPLLFEILKTDIDFSMRIRLLEMLEYSKVDPTSVMGTQVCAVGAQALADPVDSIRIAATGIIARTCLSPVAWDRLADAAKNEKEEHVAKAMNAALARWQHAPPK